MCTVFTAAQFLVSRMYGTGFTFTFLLALLRLVLFCLRAQWEDELLVAMVLAKVSSALRVPGKMDMPAMQVMNLLRTPSCDLSPTYLIQVKTLPSMPAVA